MKFECRITAVSLRHAGHLIHRVISFKEPSLKVQGYRVVLVQLEKRGLWHISPNVGNSAIEMHFEKIYGPLPLRAALARLRLGV